MQVQEIEVTIDKNGEVSVRVIGVKGESCLELTRDLEEAIGGQVQSRELTPEAYESSQEQTSIRQHT